MKVALSKVPMLTEELLKDLRLLPPQDKRDKLPPGG